MSPTLAQPEIQVEAAPILQKQRNREFIVCYQVNPVRQKAAVHKPKVELHRGTIVSVDKSAAVEVGPQIYLPVKVCEREPGAVGFYIRQEEVIEIPVGLGSQAVQAPGKLNLRTIKRANKAGKPIMDMAGVKLLEGTRFRISKVHRVTSSDPGNGVIDADGTVNYYLVSECEQVPAAAGLFIKEGEFIPVEEPEKSVEEPESQESNFGGTGGSGRSKNLYV